MLQQHYKSYMVKNWHKLTTYDIIQTNTQRIGGNFMQEYYYPRLKDIREDNDKTQKDIAEVLNTTYQYYSAYERGVRDIPSHHIVTLAKYYNVSADYLLGLSNDK